MLKRFLAVAAAVFMHASSTEGVSAAGAEGSDPPLSQLIYPPAGARAEITFVRDSLQKMGCYGSKVARNRQVDTVIGSLTRKAIYAFLDTYGRTRGARSITDYAGLKAAMNNMSGRNPPLCLDQSKELGANATLFFYFGSVNHDPDSRGIPNLANLSLGNEPNKDERLYPCAECTVNITAIQELMLANACYGSLVNKTNEIDGQIGPYTRRAITAYVEIYNKKLPDGASKLVDFKDVFSASVKTFRNPLCAEQHDVLETYFGTYHNRNAPAVTNFTSQDTPRGNYCSKGVVETDYLSSVATGMSEAAGLAQALQIVTDNFEKIFPDPKLDWYTGWDPANPKHAELLASLKEKGIKGYSYEETKETLDRAKSLFRKLSFMYGLRKNKSASNGNDCDKCFRINEWKFLNSIAQASGGLLISTESTDQNGQTVPIRSVSSAEITEAMLGRVLVNIKLYRAYASKYQEIVEKLTCVDNPPRKMCQKLDKDEMEALDQQRVDALADRDEAWSIMVRGLYESKSSEDAAKSTLMKELKYTCEGFDGTSVY